MLEKVLQYVGRNKVVQSALLTATLAYSPLVVSSGYAQEAKSTIPAGWEAPAWNPKTDMFCTTTDVGELCYENPDDAVGYFRYRLNEFQKEKKPSLEQRAAPPPYLRRKTSDKEISTELRKDASIWGIDTNGMSADEIRRKLEARKAAANRITNAPVGSVVSEEDLRTLGIISDTPNEPPPYWSGRTIVRERSSELKPSQSQEYGVTRNAEGEWCVGTRCGFANERRARLYSARLEQRAVSPPSQPREAPPPYLSGNTIAREPTPVSSYSGTSSGPTSYSKSKGCGLTCTIVGGIMTGVGTILLISLYDLHQRTKEKTDSYSKIVQEDWDPTGTIVVGIGTAAGIGLMLYGISTSD